MNKLFSYTREVGEGEEKKTLIQGVNLEYLVNYVYDGQTLYLFLDEQIEAIRIVPVPVKKKSTAENPDGWVHENQARTIKESYTIDINDAEAIERFLKYQKETGI